MRRTALTLLAACALLAPAACTTAKANKETFCRELRRTPSVTEVLAGLQSGDASSIGGKAKETDAQFAKLERSAPRDIRSDVSQVAGLVSKIAKAVEASPNDLKGIVNTLRGQALELAAARPAAYRLVHYSLHTCHYNISQTGGTSPATPGPVPVVPVTPTT